MNDLQIFENKAIKENAVIQSALNTMNEAEAKEFKLSILDIMGNDNLKDIPVEELTLQALKANAMGLPISKELGWAYLLPFKSKGKSTAVLVISVKAIKAMALATGLVTVLNSGNVYEGELCGVNRMTGTFEIDETKKISNVVIGKFAYIELKGGFKKMLFQSKADLDAHALKYSKECEWENGVKGKKKMPKFWVDEWDKMADKTIVKMLLKAVPLLNKKNSKLADMLNADDELEFNGTITENVQADEETGEIIKPKVTPEVNPFEEDVEDTELEKALDTKLPKMKDESLNGKTIRELIAIDESSIDFIIARAKTDKTDDFTNACKVYASCKGLNK